MAALVLDNPTVTVGGTDLSPFATSVTITHNVMTTQVTTFGSTGPVSHSSTKSAGNTAVVNLVQDFAASASNATVFAALGQKVAVVISPETGDASATNPHYTAMAEVHDYQPINGEAGVLVQIDVTLVVDGQWDVVVA